MTYRIRGIDRGEVDGFIGADDATLADVGAVRVVATVRPGFPCRVSLVDAEPGESLILFHHVSHDVATPYRSAYAVFVREDAGEPAEYVDQVPPVFEGRPLALRGFDGDAMLRSAALAAPGEADARIRALLDDEGIRYIDVHNAAHGCFAARVERHG